MFAFDYYKTLRIKYPSSPEEIKKAYYNLAKIEHPDKGGNEENMKRINLAYTVLNDENTKAKYDDWYVKAVLNNTTYERKEKTLINMHLITIEKNIVQRTVNPELFQFDYKKYISDNELYAYEAREGNRISTVVIYKNEWFSILSRIYPTPPNNTYTHNTSTSSNSNGGKNNAALCIYAILSICVIVLIIGIISLCDNSEKTAPTPTIEATEAPPTPTPYVPPEQPLPDTGCIIKQPVEECVAPLTIETSADDCNYYIYLQYVGEGSGYDISFFVRGGETSDISVPIGTYKMFYCSGYTWYGTQYKFGQDTAYATSDELLEFSYDDEYVYGHTITLYPVINGNFETESIDADEFPE